MARVGDRVHAPGGSGRSRLPGRLEEAVLLHLAERPVQRAHRDPEQAERPQVVLDHVAVRPLERDRQQHERRQELAGRPAGQAARARRPVAVGPVRGIRRAGARYARRGWASDGQAWLD